MDALTISDLVREAHDNAVAHGWWDEPRTFGEIVALIHSELSEALEAYRSGRGFETYDGDNGKPEGVVVELADAVIRIADVCGYLGLDLEGALRRKMAYNRFRPYRHGNKLL